MKNIIFTGGGTAGHIMPNLALIDEIKDYNIYYIGSNGMEKDIIKKYKNIKFIEIPSVKFVRSLTLKNLAIPFKLIKNINICKKIISEINPALIFSKGGYVSIPVCLAGAKLDVPVLTHESDLSVGLANKIISKKSKYLCCSFKETADLYKKNSIYTGSPVRKKILNGNSEKIRERHNIKSNKPVILIVGGSLGAKAINETIWNNLEELTKKYTLIHVVGKNHINKTIKNTNDYIQLEFVDDIENYFALSDIVISRAGSNTIFELLTIHKPMLLIPLPKGNSRGDQIQNAENFSKNKFANVLYQEDLNIKNLISKIEETLINKYTYIKNMKSYDNNLGNKKLIELINENVK